MHKTHYPDFHDQVVTIAIPRCSNGSNAAKVLVKTVLSETFSSNLLSLTLPIVVVENRLSITALHEI